MPYYTDIHFPNVQLTDLRLVPGGYALALEVLRGALQYRERDLRNGTAERFCYMCDAIVDTTWDADQIKEDMAGTLCSLISAGIDKKFGVLDWLTAYRPEVFAEMILHDRLQDKFRAHAANPNLVENPINRHEHDSVLDPIAVTEYRRDWFVHMIAQLDQLNKLHP